LDATPFALDGSYLLLAAFVLGDWPHYRLDEQRSDPCLYG